MNKPDWLLFLLLLLMGTWACSDENPKNNDPAANQQTTHTETGSIIPFPDEEGSPGENDQASLQKIEMTKKIHCRGKIQAHPHDRAVIAPPMKGFVHQLNHQTGDQVRKGEVLVELSHPGYLKIQQEYLSAKSHLEYYRQEYQRQGELAVDEAAPLNKVQRAKARFEDYQARVNSLDKQLRMLHIDPEQLKEGEPVSIITLQAPISGTITEMGVKQGALARQEQNICQIISQKRNRLKLEVHERYSHKIHAGQEITFHPLGDTSRSFSSQVEKISNHVDPASHTFEVYAPLSHLDWTFKHGRHVTAWLSAGTQHLQAVPGEALVTIENQPHVLVIKENGYLPVQVKTGVSQKGYVQIKNPAVLSGKKFARQAPRLPG